MSFSWRSSNCQRKPPKKINRKGKTWLSFDILLYTAILSSPKNLKAKITGMAIFCSSSLPSQRMEMPLKGSCTLAGVCRKHSVGQKCKYLPSLALWWQRRTSGRLIVLCTYGIPWSPRKTSLIILWWNCVAPGCLGPLLSLLIHLNFLILARKNHSYIVNKVTASNSNLPSFIPSNIPGALVSHTEDDFCLLPQLLFPRAGHSFSYLLLLSLFSKTHQSIPIFATASGKPLTLLPLSWIMQILMSGRLIKSILTDNPPLL